MQLIDRSAYTGGNPDFSQILSVNQDTRYGRPLSNLSLKKNIAESTSALRFEKENSLCMVTKDLVRDTSQDIER